MNSIFDRLAGDIPDEDPQKSPAISSSQPAEPIGSSETVDAGTIRRELKIAVQELLRQGYIEESQRHDLFRSVRVQIDAINQTLAPLDLTLNVDSHRGVAFLRIAKPEVDESSELDGWSHPLVRKQRLTLEQSLLVAILRQAFAMHEQEYGVGQSTSKLSIDELLPTFLTYFSDTGSDAKNENRLLQLLEQLKTHGIVSEVDAKQEVVIRPLIAHLANPESLSALLAVLNSAKATATNQGDD